MEFKRFIVEDASMCQFSHIRLSPAEQKEVKKLSGVMIPIYASVALVLFAVAMFAHLPHSSEAIAVAKNSPPISNIAPSR